MRETDSLVAKLGKVPTNKIFTLGELIELASKENIPLNTLAVVET